MTLNHNRSPPPRTNVAHHQSRRQPTTTPPPSEHLLPITVKKSPPLRMATEGQELMASCTISLFSAEVSQRNIRDWSKLLNDLLVEILIRLSDSELVRCTIICKSWNDTIVNVCIPKVFASAPLGELICKKKHGFGWFVSHVPDAPYARHGEIVSSFKQLSDVFPSVPKGLFFHGCCNGLLLYIRESKELFCVCNPATGQSVEIPACNEAFTRCHVSLAFDPCRSLHFKVVCYLAINCWFKFYIYSSETGRWDVQRILFDDYDVEHQWIKQTVYVNGILYCLSEPDLLLSVDIDLLKVCTIKLPFNIRNNVIGCIGASRYHLCYSNRDFYYMFVWRLEGYPDAPKWVIMHKIRIKSLISSVGIEYHESKFFMPYALDPTSDVIFIGTPESIVAYDPHGCKVIRTHCAKGDHEWLVDGQYNVYPYVRCLVSLKSHEQRHCTSLNLSKYVKHATFIEKLDKELKATNIYLWKRSVRKQLKEQYDYDIDENP